MLVHETSKCIPHGLWYNSLMQLSSTFTAWKCSQMSVWLVVCKAGLAVMEPETWPDYRFATKLKFCELFNWWVWLGNGLNRVSGWKIAAQWCLGSMVSCQPSVTFWAVLSVSILGCDRQSPFHSTNLDTGCSLHERLRWGNMMHSQ